MKHNPIKNNIFLADLAGKSWFVVSPTDSNMSFFHLIPDTATLTIRNDVDKATAERLLGEALKQISPAPETPDEVTPVIFRHIRAKIHVWGVGEVIHNQGGITIAAQINHTTKTISLGVAVCSLDENFVSQTGHEIAEKRLKTEPTTIAYEPNFSIRAHLFRAAAGNALRKDLNDLVTLYLGVTEEDGLNWGDCETGAEAIWLTPG